MNREPIPDFLKGVAIFFMMQIHITELFAKTQVYYSIPGKISLFLGGVPVAPLFMALMGYFIIYTGKSSAYIAIRGIKLIIIGLLLNIGLNFHLLIKIINGTFQINPWPYIFGVDILPSAGLSLILLSLLIKLRVKTSLQYFAIAIFFVLIGSYLQDIKTDYQAIKYLQAFFWGTYHWSYFPVFPWFSYTLVGAAFFYAKKMYENKTKLINVLMLSITVIAIVGGILFGFNISINLSEYYHHNLLFFLWAVSFLLTIVLFTNKFYNKIHKNIIDKYLRFLGRNITVIYILQWIIIGNIATAIYRTQSLFYSELWFSVILTLITFMVFVYNKYKIKRTKKNMFL